MRKRILSLLTLLLITMLTVNAQKLTVESFGVALDDLSASVYPRIDRNGNPCGLIRVQLPLEGAYFEGNVMGDTQFIRGEYWVYMSRTSYTLTILHPQYHKLKLNLRELMPAAEEGFRGIEPKVTYELVIDVPQLYSSVENVNNIKPFTVTGNGKTVTFNMVLVKAGTFQMGSTTGDENEQPVHSVTLTKDYYMGETEVTQELWYAVMGKKPTRGKHEQWESIYGLGDNYPAYYISYKDCQQFLEKLNLMTGLQFRFPTEAEWEFAARGGNRSKGYTYAGSDTIDNVAWYKSNSWYKSISRLDTHAVKTKAPNELGIYDMSGSVWEWCYDRYGSYPSVAQTDPTGPDSGSYRVSRGGGWWFEEWFCRSAIRRRNEPSLRYDNLGFRLAL